MSLLFLCPNCYDSLSLSVSLSLSGHRHHHEKKKKIIKLYIYFIDHYYFNRIDRNWDVCVVFFVLFVFWRLANGCNRVQLTAAILPHPSLSSCSPCLIWPRWLTERYVHLLRLIDWQLCTVDVESHGVCFDVGSGDALAIPSQPLSRLEAPSSRSSHRARPSLHTAFPNTLYKRRKVETVRIWTAR